MMSSSFIIILLVDILIFSAYLICVLQTFGVPINLSITYYHYERKYRGLGILFPILLFFLCITVIPIWIITTQNASLWGTNFCLFPYITLICLLAVAITARYKRKPKLIYFHYTCAIIAAICAVIWIFLVTYKVLYVGLSILFALLFAAARTKTLKDCILFWLEVAAFYAILFTLLIVYVFSIHI